MKRGTTKASGTEGSETKGRRPDVATAARAATTSTNRLTCTIGTPAAACAGETPAANADSSAERRRIKRI